MLGPLSLVARFWLVARLLPNPIPLPLYRLGTGHWALGTGFRGTPEVHPGWGTGCWGVGCRHACRHAWHCNGKRVRCLGVSAIQPLTSRQDAVAPLASRPCRPGPKPWLALPQHPSSSAKRPSRSCPRSQTLAVAFQPTRTHANMAPVALAAHETRHQQPSPRASESDPSWNAMHAQKTHAGCLIMTEFHGTRQTRAGIERVRRYNEATAPTAASPCGWSGCSCLCGGRTHSLLLHLPVHAACQG